MDRTSTRRASLDFHPSRASPSRSQSLFSPVIHQKLKITPRRNSLSGGASVAASVNSLDCPGFPKTGYKLTPSTPMKKKRDVLSISNSSSKHNAKLSSGNSASTSTTGKELSPMRTFQRSSKSTDTTSDRSRYSSASGENRRSRERKESSRSGTRDLAAKTAQTHTVSRSFVPSASKSSSRSKNASRPKNHDIHFNPNDNVTRSPTTAEKTSKSSRRRPRRSSINGATPPVTRQQHPTPRRRSVSRRSEGDVTKEMFGFDSRHSRTEVTEYEFDDEDCTKIGEFAGDNGDSNWSSPWDADPFHEVEANLAANTPRGRSKAVRRMSNPAASAATTLNTRSGHGSQRSGRGDSVSLCGSVNGRRSSSLQPGSRLQRNTLRGSWAASPLPAGRPSLNLKLVSPDLDAFSVDSVRQRQGPLRDAAAMQAFGGDNRSVSTASYTSPRKSPSNHSRHLGGTASTPSGRSTSSQRSNESSKSHKSLSSRRSANCSLTEPSSLSSTGSASPRGTKGRIGRSRRVAATNAPCDSSVTSLPALHQKMTRRGSANAAFGISDDKSVMSSMSRFQARRPSCSAASTMVTSSFKIQTFQW